MSSKVAIVSPAEWQKARAELLKQEKTATHLLADISTSRRDLPVVRIDDPARFKFDTLDGEKSLVDLFDGRRQLILYHFMLKPDDKEGCVGCSFLMDHIPNLGHLWSRDTSFVAVAQAPIQKVEAFKQRMGWTFPFYSSGKTFEAVDAAGEEVTWKPGNGYFGISVFLREGDEVFHTYSTTDRGVEILLSTYGLLDMTPLGRQEVGNGISMFRLHDQY
ncbi:hypothetical protein POJ06DRAFT_240248 [Lipomyces tetrasporus]|uniref:DUF899-domain-containing protein n=1 Tax=Lipomyces tetrasporus TaxID=54092 RepID=A0AAD7VQL5_9ASCO|nr:uncharacterized protein POJ06DRAFT_240248 [Lipomyces tetrasporus]KAJ8097719.1 hypothetical protein POJ06DRAFT_240248 [Lipomyces tetrasporus]